MKKTLVILVIVGILGVGWFVFANGSESQPSKEQTAAERRELFDKTKLSIDDPASIWVIVNKQRPLDPSDYEPEKLVAPNVPLRLSSTDTEMFMRQDAALALERMFDAAKKDGIELMLSSAYRSYNTQKNLYDRYVRLQGQTTADQQSARAGHSEHQTGLAADIEPISRKCEVETCFGDLPEGQWAATNAHKYGFVIRYMKDKTDITGYTYEPWHLRYVGTDLSQAVYEAGNPTLEEFFTLKPAADYPKQ